jgi:hypothetical protein
MKVVNSRRRKRSIYGEQPVPVDSAELSKDGAVLPASGAQNSAGAPWHSFIGKIVLSGYSETDEYDD